MSEFMISYEGDPSDAIDDPADIVEWPVNHPINSEEWRWYAVWVENAFRRGRLANGVPLPSAGNRDYAPDDCVNFLAYRTWLVQNCPTATFVANRNTVGSYEWIKIVLTGHREAMNHKLQWEGPGPAGD